MSPPEREEPGPTPETGLNQKSVTTTDRSQYTAQGLDQRIRQLVVSVRNNLIELRDLVEEARQGEIHRALGFRSWTEYVTDVLKNEGQLGREQRRELVSYLSGKGMSQRAIADAVGVGVGTVNRDLAAGVPNGTPDPEQAAIDVQVADRPGISGYDIVALQFLDAHIDHPDPGVAAAAKDAMSIVTDRETIPEAVAAVRDAARQPTIGVDGKLYPPKPSLPQRASKPRRRPITESFHDFTWKLGKDTAGLKRLADDERFARNGESLACTNLSDLKRARQRLDEVIAELERWWDR